MGLCSSSISLADWPQAELSNDFIQTTLYLPDASQGYYQGTRFDWSGAFKSLTYKGHSFIEPWFENYDPKLHDAICGPVEEFTPLGYAEAKPGDTFVKIGVGVLRKPDDKNYAFARYYDIVDQGTRNVKKHKDFLEFTHELNSPTGYAYMYHKTVKLTKGKPELVLEHSLKNTGKLPIETSTYDHNFFIIDKQPSGPTVNIEFPFDVKGEGKGFGSTILSQGKQLIYSRELAKKEQVYSAGLQGFDATSASYDIRIENQKTGAGVHITGDRPIQKMVYWACATTSCPEPYIQLKAEPGQEVKWKITYAFYEKQKQ
ncbi:hypothetical protein GO730_11990 [Spirosoma sp. HMF3257]|uniref:Aldose 1-epimerase n=1 Tax=Spirosoma telluris TaxID=2183553 RepID=A0A327NSR9_9BACT|nr:hypothetical protein [Spirosoma telluris]RAI78430.1 hypothetical protein HMF3257_11905 [Spirosoma telluris]